MCRDQSARYGCWAKCGVSDPGRENLLVADDLTALTDVVRRSPSELDQHVSHLRWRLGSGRCGRLVLLSRAICSREDPVGSEAVDAIKLLRQLRLSNAQSDRGRDVGLRSAYTKSQ